MTAIYADPRVIWERVLRRTVQTVTGCWEWTGGTNSDGYGLVGSGRSALNVTVHRVAVIVRDGRDIPDGMTVDHLCHKADECPGGRTCRHRRCVNPEHLAVTTLAVNAGRANRERASARRRAAHARAS